MKTTHVSSYNRGANLNNPAMKRDEMKNERKTAEQLVKSSFEGRMKDIKTLYKADEQHTEELGDLNDYGLSLDLVEAGTFTDQREDYIRYQLSWGGPSEEFRIYKNGDVEFWYLDWGEGAKTDVTGEDKDIITDIVTMGEDLRTTFKNMEAKNDS